MPTIISGGVGGGGGGGGGSSITSVANITALAAVASAALSAGSQAYVVSVGDFFGLHASTVTPDAITVINASGKAGYQWVRLGVMNKTWASQAVWYIDPQNTSTFASDENSGIDATHPLATFAEHTRRLVSAFIAQQTVVHVLSSQNSSDIAYYTCSISLDPSFTGSLIFTGKMTTLFTGTVTSYTKASVGPSTDDDEIHDASIPSSFTASGLLADGVLFTNLTRTAYWWAAKDLGSKTIRISRANDANASEIDPVNGDSYAACSMPTLIGVNFETVPPFSSVKFKNFVVIAPTVYPINNQYSWINCWFGGVVEAAAGGFFFNCAWGGQIFYFVNGGTWEAFNGMVRGDSANISLANSPAYSWQNRVTVQGGQILVQSGTVQFDNGDLALYDTSGIALEVSYWGLVFFSTGAISGSGNTGTVIQANLWSQIAYITSTLCVAGSFGSNPITLGASVHPVSDLPINLLSTLGIGIYKTA